MFTTLFLLSFFNHNQYSSNICNTCINVTQEIKDNNSSLQSFFEELSTLCPYTNQTRCYQNLNNTYSYIINHNSSDICLRLGFCSNLTMEDYLITSPSRNTDLYSHYNNLLGYNVTFNLNHLNNNLVWNLTFNETVESASFIEYSGSISPYMPINCYGYHYNILRVETENYVYYFNYTNDIPNYLGSIYSYNYQLFQPQHFYNRLGLNKNFTFLDSFVNETHYNLILSNWGTPHYYKCVINGQLSQCCKSSIQNLYEENYRVSFH